jgi:hypothetical protein
MLDCGTCPAGQTCGTGNVCAVTCTPKTCAQQNINCGTAGDGCGNQLACGACPANQSCGGGGTPGQCGVTCTPQSCATQGFNCGLAADGCGGTIQCGVNCPAGQTCGGGGQGNVCGTTCVPQSCAAQGFNCGLAGDGCGGTLQCGVNCPSGQNCGGGGMANVCGSMTCTPRTCASIHYTCGVIGDGCGNTLNCGTCPANQSCGGGGTAGQCGSTCVPKTCAQLDINCGPSGDGCGGTLQCGACPAGQTCGGGGTPSVCGTTCTPTTCAALGFNCGPAGDGCGGTLQCGTCTGTQTCGGGGVSGVCGTSCTPKTCAQLGIDCGPAGDGCGGTVQCGGCTLPQTCGGGGTPSVCGVTVCKPKTCASLGYDCGAAADGCGGLLQCGTCNEPQECGAASPNVCGIPSTCTGLCLKQETCATPGVTTSITGTVFAPGHAGAPAFPATGSADPLPNVLVYVPNAAVQAFTPGVSCDSCNSTVSGSPLVSTTTDVHGNFTLTNMPVGTNIPLVIQLGRWRRQIKIANVPACTTTALTADQTRLPRNKTEGDIPLMAFSTGSVDALECVMRKIGVDDSEFTLPTYLGGTGRIQIYTGINAGGATINGDGQPTEDQLWGQQSYIDPYDMVFFPCQGSQLDESSKYQNYVIDFANAGGRVFATHYSYIWLYNDAPFSGTANWDNNQAVPNDQTGTINQTFPKGLLFAQWLQYVGASTTQGQIPLHVLRDDVNGVVAPSSEWITIANPKVTMHYTFDTPVGATPANQCGRVLYDDFHVEDTENNPTDGSVVFPDECDSGAMTPQEKLLEFMIFDLSSCVSSNTPTCTPKTCAELGINCGPAGDGCGGTLACGVCPSGQTCGGGGTPSVCGTPSCTPETCAEIGIQCGPAGDGCGNLLQCGSCPSGQTCGGGGLPGVCGDQPCTPKTCAQQNISCGPAGDGCGNQLACGTCPSGQTCGGGGTPGACGAPTCIPTTCAQLGANCGPVADGCGNLLQCGTCTGTQTCGGGGTPNVCGGGGTN